jgi:glycosyltransferase involved in cell wall biosynthesis|tara:strand:- start:564 stop:1241 length:678 start_codon:yes stop_codon:yes gene_type:complete
MMNDLTLLIPAKFEKESLPEVLKELSIYNCKKLIVLKKNDLETIKSIKGKIDNTEILFQKGNGYGSALIEGIKHTKSKHLCIFNADGSFEARELIKMYRLNKTTNFVFGSRYNKDSSSEDDTIVTYIGNKFFSTMGQLFLNLRLNDILYTYIMGETKKFKLLKLREKDFRICIEIPTNIKKHNFSYTLISSHEKKRIGGEKKVNAFFDGFKILQYMLKRIFKNGK